MVMIIAYLCMVIVYLFMVIVYSAGITVNYSSILGGNVPSEEINAFSTLTASETVTAVTIQRSKRQPWFIVRYYRWQNKVQVRLS